MSIGCDVCGEPACLHITEINRGVTTARGLCEAHARTVAGVPPGTLFPTDEITRNGGNFIEFFLWLREEFQMNGTIPPAQEMLDSGRVPEMPAALLEDNATQDGFWSRLNEMAGG